MLRCMDCGEGVLRGHTYGNKTKCQECHASYRFCRDHVEGWQQLSQDEKRKWILTNKGQGGRGRKRKLQVLSEAGLSLLFTVLSR